MDHLVIRVGTGLIQFVYGSLSRLAADLIVHKILFPLSFSRAFHLAVGIEQLVGLFPDISAANSLEARTVTSLRIQYSNISQLMMIVFQVIAINSVLVPLIEGLRAQILYFSLRFEIIGGLLSHLLLFFFETKNMLKKKAVSPRCHPAS